MTEKIELRKLEYRVTQLQELVKSAFYEGLGTKTGINSDSGEWYSSEAKRCLRLGTAHTIGRSVHASEQEDIINDLKNKLVTADAIAKSRQLEIDRASRSISDLVSSGTDKDETIDRLMELANDPITILDELS